MNIHTHHAAKKLSRRRFLRGAGGTVIALPNIMNIGGAHAQANAPERIIGMFVANGLPKELTKDKLSFTDAGFQPLESLKPFEDRLCMVRGIDCKTKGPGKTPHTKGCGSFLCSTNYKKVTSKGSATVDWRFKQQKGGATALPTLNSGLWGADDADERMRTVHSWRGLNQPNEPVLSPYKLFELIFGAVPNANPQNIQDKNTIYRRSFLDPALEEYRYVMPDASGYGLAVRETISDHLNFVHDLKVKSDNLAGEDIAMPTFSCPLPDAPGRNARLDSTGVFPPKTQYWPKIRINKRRCAEVFDDKRLTLTRYFQYF